MVVEVTACVHQRARNALIIMKTSLAGERFKNAGWPRKTPIRSPGIVLANASPDMELRLTIRSVFLGFIRQVRVEAWCIRHDIPIENPYVGCPLDVEESAALKLFQEALENDND